jgi:hypothetical protein
MDLELARSVAAANWLALFAGACQFLEDHQAAMEARPPRLKIRILPNKIHDKLNEYSRIR